MTFPLPLVETRTLGKWQVHAIQAGGQQLDGGAMFGVVPKPLWERRLPADARNRIPLGMRCLLVEHEHGLVLIDSGAGNKESPKFHDIYGLENEGPHGRTALEAGLAEVGFSPEDVTLVINTHLHFDHAGGNTWQNGDGEVRPSFPNARYVVQQGELDYAGAPNERTAASYFPRNWESICAVDRFDFIRGNAALRPGIRTLLTPGHTPFHQSVILQSGGETLCFLGDVVPTAHHLSLPWIMGYDVEPLVTLESKRTLLGEAVAGDWLLVFEHDVDTSFSRIVQDAKGFRLAD